jgi:hypothetical protein
MKAKAFLTTLLLGCGLCLNPTVPNARTAERQQSAAQKPEKKAHRVMGDIPFSYSYQETLKLARQNGKPMFAYFTFAT